MRGKTLLVLAAVAAAALMHVAAADTAGTGDRDDTPGRLDLKRVRHSHEGRRLVHSAHTYARWRSSSLAGDETYIGFYLDAGSHGTRGDRFVWVRYEEGRGLYAEVFRPLSHPNGERIGPVRVSRPNRRSVKISLKPSQISKGIANGYRWRSTTSFEKTSARGACGDDGEASSFPTGACMDDAPELARAGFEHQP